MLFHPAEQAAPLPARARLRHVEQMQLMKFNGASWELFGDIIAGEVGHQAR